MIPEGRARLLYETKALESASRFLAERLTCERHAEAVAECVVCNTKFLIRWAAEAADFLAHEGEQPVASAPEAVYVLVFLPSYGWVRAIRTKSDWWAPQMDGGHGEIVYPTHWLPEPPRPKEITR